MPKAKLTFKKGDIKKVAVAASFSNVTLGNAMNIGENVIIEASYRDAQSLISMMELKAQVTGNELDGQPAAAAAKKK